ncbi:MAG TPA: NfeD family protein [Acidimicrobiales bacterium]|nr:NfeD family protein [Acidimicrobiales bacterium]
MSVLAAVLLGSVVVVSLVGFHAGPHLHAVGSALGLAAAVVLILLAIEGHPAPWVWALFACDAAVSAGLGYLAWRGLRSRAMPEGGVLTGRASEGIALTELAPEGIVRIHGEQWSAVAVNPPVHAGATVHVTSRGGVRLEVWGEEPISQIGDAERRLLEGGIE